MEGQTLKGWCGYCGKLVEGEVYEAELGDAGIDCPKCDKVLLAWDIYPFYCPKCDQHWDGCYLVNDVPHCVDCKQPLEVADK